MKRYGVWGGVVFCVLVLVLGVSFFHSRQSAEGSRYNLIIVSIDSLRRDHLSLYGYERETMPHLTAWASDKFVFENYFATSFLTPISEMSVHTGQYPFRNNVVSFSSPLKGDSFTLAEVLREHGWHTAAFGSSPEFQWFKALAASFSRGFDVFPARLRGVESIEDQALRARGGNPVQEALAWLSARKDDRPFFLWLPLGSAHWPYGQTFPQIFSDPAYDGYFAHAPSNWQTYGLIYDRTRYRASTTVENIGGIQSVNYVTDIPPVRVEDLTAEDFRYLNGRYDDGLYATDAMLRDLFVYLDKKGLAERTVVVVQSEHGEGFGDHGYIGHYDVWDTEVHVPLIVAFPGKAGRRDDALISGVDLAPTILSALTATHPAPSKLDGYDFMPYLFYGAQEPRGEVFLTRTPLWESVLSYAFGDLGKEFARVDRIERPHDSAIRTKEWKLIHRTSRDIQRTYSWWGWVRGVPVELPVYELYNVKEDPNEAHNRFEDPEVAAIAAMLREQLTQWEATQQSTVDGTEKGEGDIQEYY